MDLTVKLEATGFDSARVAASVSRILAATPLCSMATVTPDGKSYINTAYFAYSPDLTLYVLTSPATHHAQNIGLNKSVALSVFDGHQPWGSDLQGLQLFGTARLVLGSDANEAFARYSTRFPGLVQWVKSEDDVERNLESRFYEVEVDALQVFDEPEFGKEVFILATVARG